MANNKNITFDQLQSSLNTVKNELSKKANIVHTSTTSTYGSASATEYGHAKASSTTPSMAGTAAVGFETFSFARGDHVHQEQVNIAGNAGSADKLSTTIGLTIGDSRKSFDGSSDVTWSLSEIGAVATSNIATDTEVSDALKDIFG